MIERKHIEAIGAVWDKLFNEEDRQLPPLNDAAYISCCSLSAAISAALAALEESPWRSMDSAPEDAEPVLLWAPGFSDRPFVGYRFTGGKWRTEGGYDILHPTHWMPLPAAPEVKP